MFAKFRAPSIDSTDSGMSCCPPLAERTSEKRTASAPKRSTISIGSITLPSDFDIFRPCASRTSPWITALRYGMSPVSEMPDMIIRATQR